MVPSLAIAGGGVTARLQAALYDPDPAPTSNTRCAVVGLLPVGGADLSSGTWAAERLGGAGSVARIVDPLANSAASNDLSARSGIDFPVSPENPVLAECDALSVGVC